MKVNGRGKFGQLSSVVGTSALCTLFENITNLHSINVFLNHPHISDTH